MEKLNTKTQAQTRTHALTPKTMPRHGMIVSGLGILLEELDGFLVVQKVRLFCVLELCSIVKPAPLGFNPPRSIHRYSPAGLSGLATSKL